MKNGQVNVMIAICADLTIVEAGVMCGLKVTIMYLVLKRRSPSTPHSTWPPAPESVTPRISRLFSSTHMNSRSALRVRIYVCMLYDINMLARIARFFAFEFDP